MITYRKANVEDATSIAALHALSWQDAYSAILSEKFLTQEVENNRLLVWQERFKDSIDYRVLLAEKDKKLIGFVCLIPNHDEKWGALLDNIHVHPKLKGTGVGKKLFLDTLKTAQSLSTTTAMYLWVFDQNIAAIKFYENLGGKHMETIEEYVPGGGKARIRRYAWRS
ncbi:GNAT family N-acetyltransferase [Ascidiimonas sp. W6]|uniref:GNAT family N-acetyltransferase n=1 Tax=Ascidiimonas meishanensis TaxID=3128903 RepID=UPI0030EFA273